MDVCQQRHAMRHAGHRSAFMDVNERHKCIILAFLNVQERSTVSHCVVVGRHPAWKLILIQIRYFQVYNFLPSVSAAIGNYKPQRDVWKTAIALQAIVRIVVFLIYYRYYREHVYKWARYLSNVALVMYSIENTSLVTLSFWSSDKNYGMLMQAYE